MRPTIETWAMELARVTAKRSTCCRRAVGCVLLDERGHVIGMGYNGVAAGMPHCNHSVQVVNPRFLEKDADRFDLPTLKTYPHACAGVDLPPGQDSCEAVHAEINALLQCRAPYSVKVAVVTLSPCRACIKALINTGCTQLIVGAVFDPGPLELWNKLGRQTYLLDENGLRAWS